MLDIYISCTNQNIKLYNRKNNIISLIFNYILFIVDLIMVIDAIYINKDIKNTCFINKNNCTNHVCTLNKFECFKNFSTQPKDFSKTTKLSIYNYFDWFFQIDKFCLNHTCKLKDYMDNSFTLLLFFYTGLVNGILGIILLLINSGSLGISNDVDFIYILISRIIFIITIIYYVLIFVIRFKFKQLQNEVFVFSESYSKKISINDKSLIYLYDATIDLVNKQSLLLKVMLVLNIIFAILFIGLLIYEYIIFKDENLIIVTSKLPNGYFIIEGIKYKGNMNGILYFKCNNEDVIEICQEDYDQVFKEDGIYYKVHIDNLCNIEIKINDSIVDSFVFDNNKIDNKREVEIYGDKFLFIKYGNIHTNN